MSSKSSIPHAGACVSFKIAHASAWCAAPAGASRRRSAPSRYPAWCATPAHAKTVLPVVRQCAAVSILTADSSAPNMPRVQAPATPKPGNTLPADIASASSFINRPHLRDALQHRRKARPTIRVLWRIVCACGDRRTGVLLSSSFQSNGNNDRRAPLARSGLQIQGGRHCKGGGVTTCLPRKAAGLQRLRTMNQWSVPDFDCQSGLPV